MRFWVLLFLILCLWLAGAGWPVPQRTEGLRIAIAHEMTQKGTWVVPTLWGEPILTKPPGFYWALHLSELAFPGWGLTGFRLASLIALLGIVLVSAWFWMPAKGWEWREWQTAFLTGLLFIPFCLAALGQLPSAEMDVAFSFWVIAFWLIALRLGGTGEHPCQFLGPFLGSWISLGMIGGMAILFKWTAPAFFVPAGVWLWFFSPRTLFQKVIGTFFCLIPMVALPLAWLVGVGNQVGWKLLVDTIWSEAMPHLSPAHHTRSYPFIEWVTFPLQVVGMSLPAALPLLWQFPAWIRSGIKRKQVGLDSSLALLFVLIGSLLIWTLIPGHRPRHALPIAFGLLVLVLPYWMVLIKKIDLGSGSADPVKLVWVGTGLLFVLFGFALSKLGLSLGNAKARESTARILRDTQLARTLVNSDDSLQKPGKIYLGKFKDDGFVHLVGLTGIRWDPSQNPPGPVLCSAKDLEAFKVWNFAPEIRLLDQQGDPLYLLLKRKESEAGWKKR